jgi:hypothetical protein
MQHRDEGPITWRAEGWFGARAPVKSSTTHHLKEFRAPSSQGIELSDMPHTPIMRQFHIRNQRPLFESDNYALEVPKLASGHISLGRNPEDKAHLGVKKQCP